MTQLAFDQGPQQPLVAARALGEAAAAASTAAAERMQPGFAELAAAFVLRYLAQHGPSSGEDITDACKAAGIRAKDDRAIGSVYQGLCRRGQIAVAGVCARRKGHGTSGGRVWRLVR